MLAYPCILPLLVGLAFLCFVYNSMSRSRCSLASRVLYHHYSRLAVAAGVVMMRRQQQGAGPIPTYPPAPSLLPTGVPSRDPAFTMAVGPVLAYSAGPCFIALGYYSSTLGRTGGEAA